MSTTRAPLAPGVVLALDVAGSVVTATLLLLAALGLEGPARVFLALAFVTFVPGWALLGHVPVVDGMARVALAVALSLTLCTAVTQALLWLRVWEPIGVLVALGGVSLAVLLARLPWPHLATRR